MLRYIRGYCNCEVTIQAKSYMCILKTDHMLESILQSKDNEPLIILTIYKDRARNTSAFVIVCPLDVNTINSTV